ncbi:7 transmembrane sweet-taste receptor of 3 GCPR [Seminavis robusta]|uniref:7 transmembrane sweet-taste receptor of 3 GCPR n=1 Tax=Seminavis robusta TaxID=568900 RepID=A0A9N8E6H3_9STRA|nr:7 transmembrane sweet-taste receptor of 3 GCPR [Seminavis robusta]|eukprot:Sro548_g164390.1 7 transmembrane sweet-taste receptor of 3 GCPR (988) ;mRNA; r:23821-26784
MEPSSKQKTKNMASGTVDLYEYAHRRSTRPTYSWAWLFLLQVLLLLHPLTVLGDGPVVPCNSTQFCQDYFQSPNSECVVQSDSDNDDDDANSSSYIMYCSNPFTVGGCLYNMLPGWNRLRVCNSQDTLPTAVDAGHCRLSRYYKEVRFLSQNWESAFITSWIQQIILSELLDVPTSMETGMSGLEVQFYDHPLRMDYGTSNDWSALQRATERHGDCSHPASGANEEEETCAHVNVEVWEGQSDLIDELVAANMVEPSLGNGALGQQSWFIPRITALKDPTLLTYLGMRGPENRHKMAETFLLPTTWHDYCQLVSEDECDTPDDRVTRPPLDDQEGNLYHHANDYRGYFRFTDANNCTLHPTTCHGFMADYPCGWSSYSQPQAVYNDIAIEPIKYTYGELTQIWAAANDTQSHLLLHWWTPEALYQSMVGTDFELLRVSLPPANQDCIEQRITPVERCNESISVQLGDPVGACDEPSFPLQKVLTRSLYDMSKDGPLAAQSPAYDFIKGFTLSDFQLGKIFDYWLEASEYDDIPSYDLRHATCRWVVENWDDLQGFVPRTYPRVFTSDDENNNAKFAHTLQAHPFHIVALSFGICSTLLIVGVAVAVYQQRHRRVMQNAQLEFVSILLVGLVLVALAALVAALPPVNWTCITVAWLFNIGYTLELVPLVVKIAAISRMMRAARKCRRVVLDRTRLVRIVAALCMIAVLFLGVWMGVDPPHKELQLHLTNQQNDRGATIVTTTSHCESNSQAWRFISVTWHVLMLVTATVLAFQTRKLQHGINESQALAILIYSHFFFVVLRVITFFLEDSIGESQAALSRSILLSVDVIATAFIYFIPKLLSSDDDDANRSSVYASTRRMPSSIVSGSVVMPHAPQLGTTTTTTTTTTATTTRNPTCSSGINDSAKNNDVVPVMEDIESFHEDVVVDQEHAPNKEGEDGDDENGILERHFLDDDVSNENAPETDAKPEEAMTMIDGCGLRCRHCGIVN